MTLGDGVERGMRMLEFRTGSGLALHGAGRPRPRHRRSATTRDRPSAGTRRPAFATPACTNTKARRGLPGRAPSPGLLVTCGLDHILGPGEVPADNYDYPGRATMKHSLHGRVSTIPARLTGYGETWDGDRCVLWAEGIVQQSAVFGEDLHLHPAHRGRCRRQRDPHAGPRGQSWLPAHAAYVLLPCQCRLSAARRGLALPGADRRRGVGRACRRPLRAQEVGYRIVPAPRHDFRRTGLAARAECGRRRRGAGRGASTIGSVSASSW